MTTDAKIGLLLALVFIVAITFVINGLPDFLNKKEKTELTGTYINHYNRPDEPGIVDRTSREAAAVLNRKVVSVPAATAVTETNTTTQNPNYQTILPAASEVVKSSNTQQPETAEPVNAAVQTPPAAATTTAAATAVAAIKEKKSEPVAKPGEKIYQVSDGDSLASIAQKFYGQKAGGKYANIQKIYEANKGTMKSIDKLQVGQKLVIPSIAEKEKALVSSGMFEKIDSTKAVTTDKKSETVKTEEKKVEKSAEVTKKDIKTYREYVVKENDTLWKIAARNLGDGNRFNEIAQLNKNINPDNLVVGMKIKLPAK
ncbi:MAG: LysM peptidoglycan-binding domain-containing protein [Phycisphaerales bacterium]